MKNIDAFRKVYITAGGMTWCFKAADGSLIEKPEGATDKMTEGAAEIAKKTRAYVGNRYGFIQNNGY